MRGLFNSRRRRAFARSGSTLVVVALVGALNVAGASASTNASPGADVLYEADCTISGYPGAVAPFLIGLNVNASPDGSDPQGAAFGANGTIDLTLIGPVVAGLNWLGSGGAGLGASVDFAVGSTDGSATGTYSYSHTFSPVDDGAVGTAGRRLDDVTWGSGSTTLLSAGFAPQDVGAFVFGPADGGIVPGAWITSVQPGLSATISIATAAAESAPVALGLGRTTTFSDSTFDTGGAFSTNGTPAGNADIGVTAITDVSVSGVFDATYGGTPGVGDANCLETGWQNNVTSGPAQLGETQALLCCGGGLGQLSASPLAAASGGFISQPGTGVQITPPTAAHVVLFSPHPTVTVTPAVNPARTGSVEYDVVVTGTVPRPTGSVDVSDGQGGECTIDPLPTSGSGRCTIDESSTNSPFTVTATYSGDGRYESASAVTTETVIGPSTCPDLPSTGTWIGSYSSDNISPPTFGSIETTYALSGNSISGTILEATGQTTVVPGDTFSGRVDCDLMDISSGPLEAFGTLSPDGTHVSGYTVYNGFGVVAHWTMALIQTSVSTDGTSLTTDTGSTGATPAAPIQTSIASPNSGPLSISQADAGGATVNGYSLLGQVVRIEAPPASAAEPLSFTFEADASLTAGASVASVGVFRNGVLLPDCTGPAGTASPDPCVSARVLLPNGNVQLTALTSGASIWALGLPAALVSSANPSVIGQPVVLTASASSATIPAALLKGTMSFYDGATLLGTKSLKAGQASFATKKLTVGTHSITAKFLQKGSTTPVTSVLTQVVGPATTQVTVASAPNPAKRGRTVAMKATVVRVAPAAGKVAGGTVTFFDNGTPLATVVATNGKATFKTQLLSAGSHVITASYSGSTTDLTSASLTGVTESVT